MDLKDLFNFERRLPNLLALRNLYTLRQQEFKELLFHCKSA